jgi:hypothetical protein
MSQLTDFTSGVASPAERSVSAFARLATSGPFDPDRQVDSARPTVADVVRGCVAEFGPNRRKWPAEVLAAAAPFDPVAQIALGGVPRVYTRVAPVPSHVRTHRPHSTNAGIDWRPEISTDDLAIPNYSEGE